MSGHDYNRLQNLDGIEDRIIYYLLSPNNKTDLELEQVHNIWRILYYNDIDALKKPLPTYSQVTKLIYNDNGSQNDFRIFRSPRLEDGWTEECSMIKIYIDSIIPQNHLRALVNVGIDVVVNTKIINLSVPQDSIDVYIDEIVLKCVENLLAEEEFDARVIFGMRRIFCENKLPEDNKYYFYYELVQSLHRFEKDESDKTKIKAAIINKNNKYGIGKHIARNI